MSIQPPVRPQQNDDMEVDAVHTGSVEANGMSLLCEVCSEDNFEDLFGRRYGWNGLGPLGEESQEDGDPMLIEQEAVTPAVARDPGMPSQEEREVHNITHLPFRPWCEFCVRGRGKDRCHRRLESEGDQAKMSVDYGFLTQRASGVQEGAETEPTE